MNAKRAIAWGVVGVVVVGGAAVAAWPRAVVVDVGVVDRGAVVVTREEEGRTRVVARALVTAPAAGNLVKPDVVAGDEVKAGQVIARLEPLAQPLLDASMRAQQDASVRASDAAVEQAKATLARADAAQETAQKELARLKALADKGGVPRAQLDELAARAHVTEHDVEAARSAVKVSAQQALLQRAARGRVAGAGDWLEIQSPIDGVVLQVPAEHGGVVAPGQPLIEIGDARLLEVVVPLRTADALALPPSARATLSGWGGAPVKGTVRAVEPKAFTRISALGVEEQRTQVVIALDEPPPKPTLGDGYGVHVSLVQSEVQDAVRAPVGALVRRGDDWAVLVVEAGRAVERTVKVGRRAGGFVEIEAGLAAGDVVVLYPGERVLPGARIQPRG